MNKHTPKHSPDSRLTNNLAKAVVLGVSMIITITMTVAVALAAPLEAATQAETQKQASDTGPRTLQALHSKGIVDLDSKYLDNDKLPTVYLGNPNLDWETFFTDKAFWKDLPNGKWQLESQTETVLKYIAVDTQPFMKIKPILARVHVDTKTGEIISAEILWTKIGDGAYAPVPAPAPVQASKSAYANRMAKKQKDQESAAANEKMLNNIKNELHTRSGNESIKHIATTPVFESCVTDYETNGLNLRLWVEEKTILVTIEPVGATSCKPIESADSAHTKRAAWALKNVVSLPNGDVLLKNLPMHTHGPRGYCAGSAYAMTFEYWGLKLPLELITSRYTINSVYLLYTTKNWKLDPIIAAAAKEANLSYDTKPLTVNIIKGEIDKGRPINITRANQLGSRQLQIRWKTEVEKNPDYQLKPNPKSEEGRKRWATRWATPYDDRRTDIITGYNSRRKEFLITESWGESARNSRICYEELLGTATKKTMDVLHP